MKARMPWKSYSFLVILLVLLAVAPIDALQSPSKTAPDQSLAERELELAKVQEAILQPEIAQILAQHGLTTEEAHQRLAQLSPEEIHSLSNQVEQIQAAGASVPKYIWILLAVLLGVLIVAAIV